MSPPASRQLTLSPPAPCAQVYTEKYEDLVDAKHMRVTFAATVRAAAKGSLRPTDLRRLLARVTPMRKRMNFASPAEQRMAERRARLLNEALYQSSVAEAHAARRQREMEIQVSVISA